ncbi:MAG: type II secretion system F family protein, partial [Acidobacteriaceae bacterium]|nr:type II secretion system F family protein [Acidobacteriaceae bacterium]
MAEYVLKYADPRGEVHQQVAEGATEKELRDKYSQQGFLVYSIKPRNEIAGFRFGGGKKKINLEKFLIFNQQFVTLIRAGLPILKGLDLLADRLTDAKLGPFIRTVRDDVKNGSLLSDAFGRQGVFPPIYVTSVLAGEKSGALGEVLDRYITYQKLALAIRKKLLMSLIYPALLLFLVVALMVFLVTYVVPSFAELYHSMNAQLPLATEILIAVGTTARNYILAGFGAVIVAAIAFRFWIKTPKGRDAMDRVRLRLPLAGEIWTKYQVAQFSRVLGTLLV